MHMQTPTPRPADADRFSLAAEIVERNEEKRMAFGWASVAKTADGRYLVDSYGDIIREADLEAAAYRFMLSSRRADSMHGREEFAGKRAVGHVVEMVALTTEKQEAMGIPAGSTPVGVWIGMKIEDNETWERVRSGDLKMFSIGGTAKRTHAADVALREGVAKAMPPTAGHIFPDAQTFVLADLEVDEVSVVDRGANPGSHIVLVKFDGAPRTTGQILEADRLREVTDRVLDAFWTSMHEIARGAEVGDMPALLSRSLAEFTAAFEAVTTTDPAEKRDPPQESEMAKQTPAAEPSKAPAPAPSLVDLAKGASDDDRAEIMRALGLDVVVKAAEERAEKAEKAANDATEKADRLRAEREQEAFERIVTEKMARLPCEVTVAASILRKSTHGERLTEAEVAALEETLVKAAALARDSRAFSEKGHNGAGVVDDDDGRTAQEKIQAKAAALVDAEGLSMAAATAKVLADDPALAHEHANR